MILGTDVAIVWSDIMLFYIIIKQIIRQYPRIFMTNTILEFDTALKYPSLNPQPSKTNRLKQILTFLKPL